MQKVRYHSDIVLTSCNEIGKRRVLLKFPEETLLCFHKHMVHKSLIAVECTTTCFEFIYKFAKRCIGWSKFSLRLTI